MEHVVREGPEEILDRSQGEYTRYHLIQIYQTKSEVERACPQIARRRRHKQQTDHAEDHVKEIVGRLGTHQLILSRNQETCDARQHQ